jgi:hypothetical protein
MPPINQQGSRAGLIATLIAFIVLFMVAVIMWMYTNTNLTKMTAERDRLTSQYQKVARQDQLPEGGDVSTIDAAREKLNLQGSPSTVDVAIEQIKRLSQDITGTATPNYDAAEAQAATAVMSANAVLKNPTAGATAPTTAPTGGAAAAAGTGTAGPAMPAGESLVATVNKLRDALAQTAQTNARTKADLDAQKKALQDRFAAWDAQMAELNNKLAEAEKRAADCQQQLADAQKTYETKVGEVDASSKSTVDASGKQVQEMQTAVAKAQADLATANKKIEALLNELQTKRLDVRDSAVRQADGTVIRVPSPKVCYISLGQGDHLPVGMTFEVYDKGEGIPGRGKDPLGENNMPVGKASIEVVRIGQNSSECRIVHMQSGATISEGDLIANVVYDRNTTYNFFVYGNFDVDGNGIWTAQEGDIIRSLVTRWGGHVVDKIGVNTDFIVLGKEPEVPAYTKADLEDALNRDKYDKAVAALKAYQDVVNQAATLHIPILNQNRFMYYVGYFDQMKR